LAYSGIDGPTDYFHGVVGRTVGDPAAISIMLPAAVMIRLGAGRVRRAQLTGDTFEVVTDGGETRGAFLDAHHVLLEGAYQCESLPTDFQALREDSRLLLGVRSRFDPSLLRAELTTAIDARRRWLKEQRAPSGIGSGRRRTLAKALTVMKGQACTAEGLIRRRWTTPDRWPHRVLALWDSVFHAIGWRHLDAAFARDMIEAVFDGQQPDGRIPHLLSPNTTSPITQPPILAFGLQQFTGSAPDQAWLEAIYPKLGRYLAWDFAHRNVNAGGLAQWLIDPSDPNNRCAESGLDNSPRFDAGLRLEAVDFNVFLSLECSAMADFARQLGRVDEAQAWAECHQRFNRLINERLWNDEKGFFFDYNQATQRQSEVVAVTGFLPLLCGAASGAQVERLAAWLSDPAAFATAVPLPTAIPAPGKPVEKDMWRGPMWVNTNWLVALGFEKCGRKDLANRLRESTMQEIERRYLQFGSLFEFYDQDGVLAPDRLPRKGRLDSHDSHHQVVHDYGWTATLYADMVFSAQKAG